MRPKASVLILLILFGGLTSQLRAQETGAVSGTLTNSLSGEVVPNALIVLEGPGGSRQVRTGPDGKFSFTDVVGGSYHLIARANGYLPLRSELTVNAGSQTSDIRINPELHFSEVTSVSPEGKSSFETFQATNVLGGQELSREMQPTLGATLENQPGIALRLCKDVVQFDLIPQDFTQGGNPRLDRYARAVGDFVENFREHVFVGCHGVLLSPQRRYR